MSNRTLDELATDVEDATSAVEELQDDPGINTQDKLGELHDKLEQASEAIDRLEERSK
jgi:outer membrane murein-binding lipoprotein Lpp